MSEITLLGNEIDIPVDTCCIINKRNDSRHTDSKELWQAALHMFMTLSACSLWLSVGK